MSRPSRHAMFMAMARAAATRATCYRLNVGAVIISGDHNVVAIGYNGAPSGEPHCTGEGCRYFTSEGCKVVHAEQNALARLSEDWWAGSLTLYVTHSPCGACARALVASKLMSRVYFETPYRDPAPLKVLMDGGVQVWQLLPSGMAVSQATGQLVTL